MTRFALIIRAPERIAQGMRRIGTTDDRANPGAALAGGHTAGQSMASRTVLAVGENFPESAGENVAPGVIWVARRWYV
jgi:hypothetical protein